MAGARNDPDRKLFAEELRAIRKQRGLTRDQLGAMINYSGSSIGNIEAMMRAPTRVMAKWLDEALDLPGTLQRMEERIRGVPFSAGFRPFYPYEAEARVLRWFEHSLVPGLFQTEDYARALFSTFPGATPEDIEGRVTGRMGRQSILHRNEPPPPHIWTVLDEQVLHRNVGGPKVMVTQTEHLLKLAQMPRNTIQVLSWDRPNLGLRGAFVVAELAEPPAIVYLENASDGETIEDAEMAEEMTLKFDGLRTEALTGSASLTMIEEAIQRWQERTGA